MTAQSRKGFTLIELLIVIAILGVLAVVVLVAINPVQQLARTRDAGRKSSVSQIGHAVAAYYTSRNGTYPAQATWGSDLTTSGELSSLPSSIAYTAGTVTSGCSANNSNNYCYYTNATEGAVVYAKLESQAERSKCGAAEAWFAYSVQKGRGGIVCGTEPTGAISFTVD
jgi:prepilin-type N-terminal cleavage/methylation domain-containing protein